MEVQEKFIGNASMVINGQQKSRHVQRKEMVANNVDTKSEPPEMKMNPLCTKGGSPQNRHSGLVS